MECSKKENNHGSFPEWQISVKDTIIKRKRRKVMEVLKKFYEEEEGLEVVEMVVLMAVLVGELSRILHS